MKKNENWEIDRSSIWQGAIPGRGQEMNDSLSYIPLTIINFDSNNPQVHPGDMLFWHCDTIHAVDSVQRGQTDSCVFYIPAAPLCQANVGYLLHQRRSFEHGIVPPDFPGGEGESHHVGRTTPRDINTLEGRRAMSLELFKVKCYRTSEEKEILSKANIELHRSLNNNGYI